ncbi:MAG: hypothetical protein LC126_00685 [Bryobacterales bacterium]|nr:hypothetical protein [Bryobacterales bacterium]
MLSLGRPVEARQRMEQALSVFQAAHEYPAERISLDSGLVTVLAALADYHASRGDSRRAIAAYQELPDKVMASKPDPWSDLRDAKKLSNLYRPLIGLYRVVRDGAKADAMEARRLELPTPPCRTLWRHRRSGCPESAT